MKISLTWVAGVVLTVMSGAATANDYPRVRIETNAGDFVIELDAGRAPLTVANFLQYVEDGFYEGVLFHRVVNGFVVQAGGFDTNLQPKAGRDTIPNESGNGLSNQRMSVAMARTNDPHSGNSQFYVNLADNAALDPKPSRWGYAVFGKVVSGTEVIDDIGHRAVKSEGQFAEIPVDPVIIEKAVLESAEPEGG